jgi:hypothetical protein
LKKIKNSEEDKSLDKYAKDSLFCRKAALILKLEDQSKGAGLLRITDLTSEISNFTEMSYTEFIQQFDLSQFQALLPDSTEFPPAPNNGKRTQPKRPKKRGIDGEYIRSPFQYAHIAPLAVECIQNWLPVCIPFFDTPSCHIQPAQLAAQYFMFGVERNGCRVANTGFLHCDWNFIQWSQQFFNLDTYPSIMFIPLKDSAAAYFVPATIERYLIICMDPMSSISSLVPAITEHANDMNCTDPQAIRAVEIFNEYLVHVTGHLRKEDVIYAQNSSTYKAKAKLAADFREFLRDQPGVVVPKLPEQGRIAVLEIGNNSDHGSPHPFFLALRSMNAWLSLNHRQKRMKNWLDYLHTKYDAKQVSRLLDVPLLLLTACRDHVGDIMTCLLCKSQAILSDPDQFEEVDWKTMELAQTYIDNMESLSAAEIDQLDNVKIRDSEDRDLFEDTDSFESSASFDVAGARQETLSIVPEIRFAPLGEGTEHAGAGNFGAREQGELTKLELR